MQRVKKCMTVALFPFTVRFKSPDPFLISMAAGIAVFGRNRMDRKFGLEEFQRVREYPRLPASPVTFMNPVESVYPRNLTDAKLAYAEGILAGVILERSPEG
jgi:hypothetical protein